MTQKISAALVGHRRGTPRAVREDAWRRCVQDVQRIRRAIGRRLLPGPCSPRPGGEHGRRRAPLVGFYLCAALASSHPPVSAQSPADRQQAQEATFNGALREVEAAQVELVNGRPDAFKALWSHAEDVTLAGGLGGVVAKGWPEVSARLDWVATQYADGSRTHQEVSRYVGQELAYVVLRETITFTNPADRRRAVQELRVTQIFRREGERWRILHRHADAQVTRQTIGEEL